MQFIEIIFTGPPNPDVALQMLKIVDDRGEEVTIGEFYHDGRFWRYQIPVELVPRMIVPHSPTGRLPKADDDVPEGVRSGRVDRPYGSDAAAKRAELKERLGARPGRTRPQSAEPVPDLETETCPNCKGKFSPKEYELLDCPKCEEKRCTKTCLPNPVDPCLDCQALNAGPEENDFEGEPIVRPAGRRPKEAAPAGVFTPGFSEAAVKAAGARGLAETEEDDADGEDQ